MISYKEYFENPNKVDPNELHRLYYAQFVTEQIKHLVRNRIGLSRSQGSTDPICFNDIHLINWNRFGYSFDCFTKMREADDYPTLASKGCILEEAARQILEEIQCTKSN